jgi:hypothetical protein
MKTAPKKIQTQAIEAACLYRDAVEGGVHPDTLLDVTDLRKEAFDALVAAMECGENEILMVHETLADIVRQTPRKPFTEKRLLRYGS